MLLTDDQIRQIVQEQADIVMSDCYDVLDEVYDILEEEANALYDSFITQFYSYKTESYYRHWEPAPGTQKGTNLYYGKHIKRTKGKIPSLKVSFSGEDMANYPKGVSANTVLDYVMEGTRFPAPNFMTWDGFYYCRRLKRTYAGTLESAFTQFWKEFDDIEYELFNARWTKLGY